MGEVDSNPLLESAMEQRLIRRIVGECVTAIDGLWDKTRGCYWRDTEHSQSTSVDATEFFPTVTYRSTEALLDLIFRHPDWAPDEKDTIIEDHLPRIFSRTLAERPSALDDPGSDVRNPFTTALYIITSSRANDLKQKPDIVPLANIEAAMEQLLIACVDENSPYFRERHPFIEFHNLRAIIAATPRLAGRPVAERVAQLRLQILNDVKSTTQRLLARHMLKQLLPSDSVALMFCAATLAFADGPEDRNYVLPAMTVGFESQDTSGCWPLGRILRESRGERGHRAWDFTISTYEIAWAATETLLRLLQQSEAIPEPDVRFALEHLYLAGRYAERSLIELPGKPSRGWASDPPYAKSRIESWTSANVLQSIISLSELIDEVRCGETLKQFVVLDPRSGEWPSWKRWAQLAKDEEPDDSHPIFKYLTENVIEKINSDPQNLPSREDETVSLLFFGPPGTSKTTIAHALADALQWPIVTLSPGDFIEKGLEYIEAQAQVVFERLQKLRRVVVLFDECDELFRERQPEHSPEQTRSISAFVTACMLPKLQDLHDRGRVLFCICTNKIRSLDSAMKRRGRIDHVIGVPPPQDAYRRRFVQREFSSSPESEGKTVAIQTLVDDTDRFVRLEIQRACQDILTSKLDWEDLRAVAHTVSEVVTKSRDSLTITPGEYKDFKEDQQKYSHPVIR